MSTFPLRLPHAAARRAGGLASLALALAFASITVGGTLPTPLYGLYGDRFGFSTGVGTLVYGAYALGTLTALVLFGRASDALGRRPLALAAIALGAASSVAFLLADGLAVLLLARVLSGLSVATAAGAVTAHLVELDPGGDRTRAARLATFANLGGLAAGPLLAGILAEHAAAPTQLAFVVHLALLAVGALLVLAVPETVERRRDAAWRAPRLGIPPEVRAAFGPAALATAAAFVVFGLFAGLAIRFVRGELGSASFALAGAATFAAFGAAAVAQLAVATVGLPRAMRGGLIAIPLGLALLVAALASGSIALFALAALLGGAGAGLAFVAALGLVGAAAPPARRAEAVSSLFVVAYASMSLPVVGVGLSAELVGLLPATSLFSAATALLALAVLVRGTDPERTHAS